jgi:alanyl-tRNA synthetase
VTGSGAVQLYQQQREVLEGVLSSLKIPVAQAVDTVEKLQSEVKRLSREVGALKMKAAIGGTGASPDDILEVGGVKLIARNAPGLDKTALRTLSDSLRDRLKSGVVVLASAVDGKVTMTVAVTKDLIGRVSAGDLVKRLAPIVGGGGGGRPDFAEAGGKDPSKIDEMLSQSAKILEQTLK